ncbi:MAG: rhomboid family intramembrane serine protease [Vallitalea sp.]|jgi:rhomboid protease GluP|nr:rhomboid family intramembrane serine protease [Vallitalea sp.]
MKTTTYNNLCRLLENYEYQGIPTDSEKVKMYATFSNNSLYLINIISLDDSYTFNKDKFKEYKTITWKQFSRVNANKIILLNLLLTDNVEDIYSDVNYTPDFDDDIIDINWIVNINEERLIIPSEQVSSVIGLEKDIRKLLKSNDESYIPEKMLENNNKPYVTYSLITINIVIWILMELAGGTTNIEILVKYGAIDSFSFFIKHEYYRLFTSMFIHIGIFHLIYNIFGLYIFGTRLEKHMKSWSFILLYILSGFFGGILSIVIDYVNNRVIISAGASGAIYGIIGAIIIYSIVYRKEIGGLTSSTLLIMFIIGIAVGSINPQIRNLVHLGGFIGGAIVAYVMTRIPQRNTVEQI